MRVMLVEREEGFSVGGAGVYTNRFYQYLLENNHQAVIARFTHFKNANKSTYTIPFFFGDPRIYPVIPHPMTLNIFNQHLKEFKPDLVYMSLGISIFDFFMPKLCRSQRIPFCGIYHLDVNTKNDLFGILSKIFFLPYAFFGKHIDLNHVFSDKLRQFFQKFGTPKEKIIVLPNGVDTQFYKPGPSVFAKKHAIKRGVIFLGRITMQKNPRLLIESFLSMKPDKNTKLVMVGEGELKNELEKKYRDRQIIFTGLVTNPEKKLDIIRSCQVFVLPSIFEGMSLALLECMACGLVPLVTDAGSNDEVIGDAGFIINLDNLRSNLTSELEKCLQSDDLIKNLGKLARKRTVLFYNQDKIFAYLTTAFEKLIRSYRVKTYR